MARIAYGYKNLCGHFWSLDKKFLTIEVNLVEMIALLDRYPIGNRRAVMNYKIFNLFRVSVHLTADEAAQILDDERLDPLDILLDRRPLLTVVPWKPKGSS